MPQILPPLKGISRSLAYQGQPPYTCYDAQNVWPREPSQGRARMGTRPGLVKLIHRPDYGAWRLFETINVKSNDRYRIWYEGFNGSSFPWGQTIANLSASLPSVSNGLAYSLGGGADPRAFAIPTPTGFDAGQPFRFGVYVVPEVLNVWTIRLYFGMASSADANDCYYFQMNTISTTSLRQVVGGVATSITTTAYSGATTPEGWLEVDVNGTTASLYWRGELVATGTLPSAVTSSATGLGVYLLGGSAGGNRRCQIDHVRVEYKNTTDYDVIRPIIVASQNGLLYRNYYNNHLTQSIATRTLASDHRVLGADWGQLKFLADWSFPIASGGDGILASTSFDATSVTDWTTVFSGKNYEDYVVVILSEDGRGTYPITAVASGSLTITGGSSVSNAKWWIMRAPKVYDPVADGESILASGTNGVITGGNTFDSATYTDWTSTFAGKLDSDVFAKYSIEILSGSTVTARYTVGSVSVGSLGVTGASNGTGLTFRIVRNDKLVNWTATAGTVPVGCSIIAMYRGALYLAGDPTDPNEWYKSRNGDPYDFDFTATDAGAPTKGSAAEAYRLGDAITALIPYADHFMLIGCRSSIWRMTDDVTDGGEIASVNRSVGIASSTAWCYGENGGQVFFLSPSQGIWATQIDCPTCDAVRVSGDELPRELYQIARDAEISMAYDVVNRGIHIFVSPPYSNPATVASPVYWFFDLATKGFFPVQYALEEMNPLAAVQYNGVDPRDNCILLACMNGNIMRYSWTADRDDVSTITSYVHLGPMQLGESGSDAGIVAEMVGNLSQDSNDVTWGLYVGNRAENVVSGSAVITGTFRAGTVRRVQPRRKGGAFALRLSGTSRWAFESVSVFTEPAGELR